MRLKSPIRTFLLRTVIVGFIALFVGFVGECIMMAIWPGEAKLLAPVFCDAGQSEAIVVSDTHRDARGASTNFRMYCVGDRGDYTNVGWMRPMLLLALIHTAIVLLLYHGIRAYGRLRRYRDRRDVNGGRSGAAAPTLGG